ncbi:hypothetical protein [Loigolactobacillus rennini]|uniref:Uncharacterized protein n=1 Tax=Loigolactobacillus rennini DSM 20253 TaxID=1423796 RepID=A0A0R2D4F9_9LACO|nr:hypothetical protein [Loigolactobacillus rennini]KRM95270.1 hypothetical protein FC24_GL002166 [Loigolactobacillus rennini DSM 20253]
MKNKYPYCQLKEISELLKDDETTVRVTGIDPYGKRFVVKFEELKIIAAAFLSLEAGTYYSPFCKRRLL